MAYKYVDAYAVSDAELGKRIEDLFGASLTQEEVGKTVREWFDHCCKGQLERQTDERFAMFTRYMKDAWSSPEGESTILHAMRLLGRFKRHEDRLRALVAGKTNADDVPILAACEIIRNGEMDLVCVPIDKDGVNHG